MAMVTENGITPGVVFCPYNGKICPDKPIQCDGRPVAQQLMDQIGDTVVPEVPTHATRNEARIVNAQRNKIFGGWQYERNRAIGATRKPCLQRRLNG